MNTYCVVERFCAECEHHITECDNCGLIFENRQEIMCRRKKNENIHTHVNGQCN